MDLISKTNADAKGLKRFYTGKKCRNGHIDERYVKTGNCCSCGKLIYSQRDYGGKKSRYRPTKESILFDKKQFYKPAKVYIDDLEISITSSPLTNDESLHSRLGTTLFGKSYSQK